MVKTYIKNNSGANLVTNTKNVKTRDRDVKNADLAYDITLKRRNFAAFCRRSSIVIKIIASILIYLILFTNFLYDTKKTLIQDLCKFSSHYGFVVKNIIVEGDIEILTNHKISNILKIRKDTPIFLVNLKEIKKALEAQVWVEKAILERRLPNSLHIALFKKKPIAIWQNNKKLYLIDEFGQIITDQDLADYKNMIYVIGNGANVYAKNLIDIISRYDGLRDKVISASRYGNRRWDLLIEGNITVKMPEQDLTQAIKYLSELNTLGRLSGEPIYKMIDLRDQSKYYVE